MRVQAKFDVSLLALALLCLLCVAWAQDQPSDRLLKKTTWPNEPLEISNLKLGDKPIAFGEKFAAGNEWIKEVTFDVRNVSGKTITFFDISLHLPSPGPQTPGGLVAMIWHGANTALPNVAPTVRMQPGEMLHAIYTDKRYASFKHMRDHIGLKLVTQLSLQIERVLFDDDTCWSHGEIMRRDPSNPLAFVVAGREHLALKPSSAPVASLPLVDGAGLKTRMLELGMADKAPGFPPPHAGTVKVQPQSGAPLLLSLQDVHARDPLQPSIGFRIENTSGRNVRAFAIRHDDVLEKDDIRSGLVYGDVFPMQFIMKPGQWKGASFTHTKLPTPPREIIYSIDFVEFEDGTTWGADTLKASERLAGRRAGATAEQERLLRLLVMSGLTAVNADVAREEFDVAVPPTHSPEWAEAFRKAAQTVRARLRYAYKEGGATAMQTTLQQPMTDLTN